MPFPPHCVCGSLKFPPPKTLLASQVPQAGSALNGGIPSIPRDASPRSVLDNGKLGASRVQSGLSFPARPRVNDPELAALAFLNSPAQLGRISPLTAEIIALTQSSSRYASFAPNLITDSATVLARYRISNIESPRRVGKQARTYLFENSRRR